MSLIGDYSLENEGQECVSERGSDTDYSRVCGCAGLGEHVSPFAPTQWELVLQTLRKIPAVGEAMGVAGGRKVILIQSVSKK